MSKFHRSAAIVCIASATVLLLVTSPASADPIVDPTGDFIPSYTGPKNADLDITSAEAIYNGSTFQLNATMAGNIGQTSTGLYVWGFNRGAGTAGFGAIAPGVLFDEVVIINPAAGTVTVRDLISGTGTVLPASAITISGNKLSITIPAKLLTSEGFNAAQFLVNLWPRSSAGGNQTISDFAPDDSDAALTLDFPRPYDASVQTEVAFDTASERFEQIQGRLDAQRGQGDKRFGWFLDAGGDSGTRGLGDSLMRQHSEGLVTGGADIALSPDFVLGAALSYDNVNTNLVDGSQLKDVDTGVSLYGGWHRGPFHVDGYAASAGLRFNSVRILPIPGLNEVATARPDGHVTSLGLSTGYDIPAGNWVVTPLADLLVSNAHISGYTEDNADLFGSTVSARDRTSSRLGIGLQGRYTSAQSWGTLALSLRGRFVSELSDKQDTITYAFTAEPDEFFQIEGPKTGTNYEAIDIGAAAILKTGLSLGITYSPRISAGKITDQAALISLSKAF